MLKRKLAILAVDENIAIFFQNELDSIFEGLFEIKYYTTSTTPLPFIYDSDLILYTDPSILIEFMDYIKSKCPVMMMKRTISKDAVEILSNIPSNSNCLVANINSFMANETLTTIYQLGFTDFTMTPCYPEKQTYPDNIDYIIGHEEYSFLPDVTVEKVIIGNRIFDINTILDILAILDIDSKIAEDIILKYSKKLPSILKGVNYTLENKRILSSQWKILLDELSDGVIVTDEKNRINIINSNLMEILGDAISRFEYKTIGELIREYPSLGVMDSNTDINNELFIYDGKKLIITVKKVMSKSSYYGKVILIRNYSDIVKVQQKIHDKIIGKGYYSKHTFESIIGNDEKIKDAISICKKISNTDSSILIFGESGTGKELFAGAIHNYSERKNHPFIAVNCAALPNNLLESELFGYEEGAFTGAKKGGKIGFFESADKGTLFLDEISEIPLELQARLLRVLQEKEVMKIGGDSIKKIDTRIIAATNKDLLKMVQSGKFRKDLFFRLNIFQIDIPPLRERDNDIYLLMEKFMRDIESSKKFSTSLMTFVGRYDWIGNIRELYNVMQYMNTISDGKLTPEFLPSYLKERKYLEFKIKNKFLSTSLFVLKAIDDLNKNGMNSGRRSITSYFSKKFYPISELDTRKILEQLENEGLIEVFKGPKGCIINNKGIDFIENNI